MLSLLDQQTSLCAFFSLPYSPRGGLDGVTSTARLERALYMVASLWFLSFHSFKSRSQGNPDFGRRTSTF
jgi:hypothetical protein